MNGYDNQAVLHIRDGRKISPLTQKKNIFYYFYLIVLFLEFLLKEDCNFIAVDWEELANNVNYYSSASNTLPVGNLTGDFINFLIAQGVEVNQFHVIGFSLGAHVAGNAGAVLKGLIPRITGNYKYIRKWGGVSLLVNIGFRFGSGFSWILIREYRWKAGHDGRQVCWYYAHKQWHTFEWRAEFSWFDRTPGFLAKWRQSTTGTKCLHIKLWLRNSITLFIKLL